MVCDFYIQTELVVEYTDMYCVMHKTKTNTLLKQYMLTVPENNSDCDLETRLDKYNKELKNCVERNTYNTILYENDFWVKESYKKRYNKQISLLCPDLHKLLKIYKKHTSWVHL